MRVISIFVCSFVMFTVNLRYNAAGDPFPTTLLPICLAGDGSLCLDRFEPWVNKHPGFAYCFPRRHDHNYSLYPIATSLLATPIMAPAYIFLGASQWTPEALVPLALLLGKLSAALIAAGAVAWFYVLCRRLGCQKTALLLALLLAFATPMWSVASQALWQHGPGVLMIVGSLYFLLGLVQGKNAILNSLLAGLFLALCVAIRPMNVMFVASCWPFLLVNYRRKWSVYAAFVVFPLIIIGGLALYNLRAFGNIGGGYGTLATKEMITDDFLNGLLGVLCSPGHGLFIYIPCFIFVPLGIVLWIRQRELVTAPIFLACLSHVLLQTSMISALPFWHGGYCFGPRYLIEIMPSLIILLIPALPWLNGALYRRMVFALALIGAVSIQAVGTFGYPQGGWDSAPVSVDSCPSRLWDWADNPIRRNAHIRYFLAPYRHPMETFVPLEYRR